MTKWVLLAGIANLVLAGTAAAQSGPFQSVSGALGVAREQADKGVRVQNNISYFVAGPAGAGDEAQKLRDDARKAIYASAERECEVLKAVLAAECRLVNISVNINANRAMNPGQPEGFMVSGSMSYAITPK